jgi:formylglycine-generating enzyme required for sulfatase activity
MIFTRKTFLHMLALALVPELALTRLARAQDENEGENQRGPGVLSKKALLGNFTRYRTLHAVIVGVNWKGPRPLKYAEDDAKELADVLVEHYGFERNNIRLLRGKEATRDAVERELNALKARVSEDDAVIVYFATHGERTKDESPLGYIRPYGSEFDQETGAATLCLSTNLVLDILRSVKSQHVLLLGDFCFAGFLNRARGGEGIATIVKNLRKYKSRQVLAAAKDDQVVVERDELKHGLFTHYLLQELRELARTSGAFTASELYSRLQKVASTDTQTPDYGNFDKVTNDFVFLPKPTGPAPKPISTLQITVNTFFEAPFPSATGALPLRVTTAVTSFEVLVDNKPIAGNNGTYVLDLIGVPDGERTALITVKAPGYIPSVLQVKLVVGNTLPLTFTLDSVPVAKTSPIVEPTASPKAPPKAPTGRKMLTIPKSLTQYPALEAYLKEMRAIPGGTFQMGTPADQIAALTKAFGDSQFEDEGPVHSVTLSSFWMGRTPVTWAVWDEYCAATGVKTTKPNFPGLDGTHPVVNVSWNDCEKFCQWASNLSGVTLTLPTEAQWEYAARGGLKGKPYPWGGDPSQIRASFDESKLWLSKPTASVDRTNNVFENGYGLTDMGGNVLQWCLDYYDPNFYKREEAIRQNPMNGTSALRDPAKPDLGAYDHVARGSSAYFPLSSRCANRFGGWFDVSSEGGFRLSAVP